MRAADYGKPCGRQSDCAQCTVDHACTCTKIPNSNHSCCQPNGLAPHVDRETYAFGVPLDPNLPGTENGTFTSFKAIVRTPNVWNLASALLLFWSLEREMAFFACRSWCWTRQIKNAPAWRCGG